MIHSFGRCFIQRFIALVAITLFCSQARASSYYHSRGNYRKVGYTGKVKHLGQSSSYNDDGTRRLSSRSLKKDSSEDNHQESSDCSQTEYDRETDSSKRLSRRSLSERHAAAMRQLAAEKAAKEAELHRATTTAKQLHYPATTKCYSDHAFDSRAELRRKKQRQAKELENEIWSN